MASSPLRPARPLITDTLRAHRWGALAWIVGGAVAMLTIGLGFIEEVERFPGGAVEMAAGMRPGVEAMRLLRWPAERIDTLGGYLAYHNVTLFSLGLAAYGAVQGAHAIRTAETRGVQAEILAAGRPRTAALVDRAIGFAAVLSVICLGLGAGIAAAMALGGEPDTSGSFTTALVMGLCAYAGYGLGMLLGQLTPGLRTGTGLAVLLLTTLYLLTNIWSEIGPAGAVRFLSPFHYANYSRALVPGRGLDLAPSLILFAVSLALLAAAALVYRRRDYASGLFAHRARPHRPVRNVQRPALRAVWSATLLRHRTGLLSWMLAAAAYLALLSRLEPAFADMFDEFSYTQGLLGPDSGHSLTDRYLAFAGQLIMPIVTAYIITQAAGWVGELRQGHVELLLSSPLSWPRLVAQRLLAALIGAALVAGAGIGGLAVVAAANGTGLDGAGLARLAADTLLLAAALAAVAALAVAWLRSTAAVGALAVFVGLSYLVVYLVPLFAWPDWVNRISLFGAFGNPYLELPPVAGTVVLLSVAVLGSLGAATVAQRTPKVAG
ncbi:ABC transporter permease [Glycomyces sp. YM15]|uniref:ABC transporter permease n=1 Tax=Glycomyces sp. YM15 TaxID=2800446 RepID=UPI0019666D64|nr:ABC transporter permease [Glycomyces sp. YM15]